MGCQVETIIGWFTKAAYADGYAGFDVGGDIPVGVDEFWS